MNNLFVSYDLNTPGQNYDAVITAIKSLGSWAKVQKSFWYVKSNLSESDAVDKVWPHMDRNDSLIVVNATTGQAAWQGLSAEVANFIRENWNR